MAGFNTTGVLQKTPAPNAGKAEDANAGVKAADSEIASLDALQMLLDVIGLIPGLGAPADILNGLISAGRGDFIGAGLSFFGVVPVAGEAATVAKIAKNSEKYMQALDVVTKKVLPHLPAGVRSKIEDAIAQAKKKIEELSGTKPKPEPEPPPKPTGEKEPGKKIAPKPKPKCGQSGPYKDRKDHDNNGMNWDHVPSQKALLQRARAVAGRALKPNEIAAIIENAPTIAIPAGMHQQQSETFAGRQHQSIDGVRRPDRDAQDLQRATKENTNKILKDIDKYDRGCKGAYKKAAKKLAQRTDAEWADWLKQTMKGSRK